MSRRRRTQAGFTLIEVMVVVVMIALLAAIALPNFLDTSRKTRSASEVPTIFQDLRTRMDQYFQETGSYPATIGESTLHPATPTSTKQAILPLPTTWSAIKVRISNTNEVYCGFTWVTGLANSATNIGPQGAAFGFTAPATDWYYLLAKCDLDGNATVDSYYFSSSVDVSIKKTNEGR